MISYCQKGKRRYDLYPVLPYIRNDWELQMVLSGELIILDNQPQTLPYSRQIFLFGPLCSHGWRTPDGVEAEIIVFHFQTVPDIISLMCSEDAWWGRTLHDAAFFEEKYAEVAKLMALKNPFNSLHFAKIQAEIFLKLFEGQDLGNITQEEYGRQKVNQAVSWFKANLETNPRVETVAEHLHISTSQLRRLFGEVMKMSPQQVLSNLKFERAATLLRDTTMSIEEVAYASGYDNPSNFSRGFKKRFNQSPLQYRASSNASQYREG
ncbi:MAG: helix-turn-helix transcriptional regulator [Planctomycetes bacterium]|nr:helix-turn-helix transcriptional regulator [Planctomycetota bacterium]